MRFLADEMLKKTAKWLRLIGYDTEFLEGDDTAVLAEAGKSGRVLLTKDEELAKRADKVGIPFLFLRQEKLEEDLAIIMDRYGLEAGFPEKTRCPECNGKLEGKDCASLEGIPEDVVGGKRKCWKCSSCGKNYWEGGHWINIKKVLGKIEEQRRILSKKK
ncbi:MAG: Mut7-C RNAse domain-containing protein [Candidatus ainarchaeum sp.]|nr:Mut7-C RNAse domain-containing protein [Candidatus ainarchaeum sp.]MDD5096423.1 Mut7-C RNAse domain-containing protein [Candidatus ainarchaeum sp.]